GFVRCFVERLHENTFFVEVFFVFLKTILKQRQYFYPPNFNIIRKLVTCMADMKEQETVNHEKLLTLLQEEDTEGFRDEFLNLHPYEQAMFYREQREAERLRIYTYLSPKEMSDI